MVTLQPEHILAISMFSLLGLGLVAQGMRQCGGRCARMAPVVVLALLLLVSLVSLSAMSSMLSSQPDWEVAAGSDEAGRAA